MPALRTLLSRDGLVMVNNLRSFIGFGLIGAVNIILPSIIYSSSYLIIPYSRPVGILIETLPALAVKILLPQILHRLPTKVRPCILAACWCLAAIVTAATPPNVPPLPRVAMVMLASAASAAADLSFLAQTRCYGSYALAGWGFGTGSGGFVQALIPIMVSSIPKFFLRTTVNYVYHIVVVLLVGYYLTLPAATLAHVGGRELSRKPPSDISDEEELTATNMQIEEPVPAPTTARGTMSRKLGLVQPFIRTLTVPMTIAFVLTSYISPATVRIQPKAAPFETFSDFQAAFVFAVQLGSMVSRSLMPFLRKKNARLSTRVLYVCFAMLFFNGLFALISSDLVLFLLASGVGLACGAIYITTFAGLTEQLQDSADASELNFAFGVVSAGETGGVLLGSLLGSIMERVVCGSDNSQRRWCSSTR